LNGQINIEADRELLPEVRAKGDAVEVAERLYKGVDGKVGASEAGIAIKFENANGISKT
jgi:hypothetical protein